MRDEPCEAWKRGTVTPMSRAFSVLVVLLLSACGRTEPLRGPIEVDPPEPPHAAVEIDAGTALDGGQIISGPCIGLSQTCPSGFHCESGSCVLNGDDAALQVTLQWQNSPRTPDDLDLHLIEPAGSSTCEIYFGTGGLFSCTPVGILDLDANAGCFDTTATSGLAFDTENIIYPPNVPVPVGHYIVRVDYYAECLAGVEVPFVVTVRKGTTITRRTGVFRPGTADSGDLGSGLTMIEFDIP